MSDRKRVTKVRKNNEGDITDVMLEDNTVLTVSEAIQMARNNGLEGVNVGRSRAGTEFLRGAADGDPTNNLDNLPTF